MVVESEKVGYIYSLYTSLSLSLFLSLSLSLTPGASIVRVDIHSGLTSTSIVQTAVKTCVNWMKVTWHDSLHLSCVQKTYGKGDVANGKSFGKTESQPERVEMMGSMIQFLFYVKSIL